MDELIYLDCASLMPPTERVLNFTSNVMRAAWGNPHALHAVGYRASEALERARIQVAEYLDTSPSEIVFAPGGRDAMALAAALALEPSGKLPGPIVSSRLEHPATIRLAEALAARAGRDLVWLEMPEGSLSDADHECVGKASLVILSLVNHEMGTALCSENFVTTGIRIIDAVQAAPWVPLRPILDDRTFCILSGAKLGGPLGVGVLRVPARFYYAARDTENPLETASLPWGAAVPLGEACAARADRNAHLSAARQRAQQLLTGMLRISPDLLLNGRDGIRLGPIVNVSFPGHVGKDLAAQLAFRRICISHTAACRARAENQSPVVRAAYPHEPARAIGATRWSVSEATTEQEVERALGVLESLLRRPSS